MTTATRDKIAAKVRALQERTTDRGCTEAEAMTAASLAAKLISEHDLSMTDIELGDATCSQTSIDTGRKTSHEISFCVRAIAFFTDTMAWKGQGESGTVHTYFFGREIDTDCAKYLYGVIKTAMETEHAAFKFDSFLYERDTGRRSGHAFLLGMAKRVSERLREMKKAQNDANIASTGRDLIVVKQALVLSEFAKLGIRLGSGSHSTHGDEAAYGAGHAAGNRVGLNRPVGHSGGSNGYMIGRD